MNPRAAQTTYTLSRGASSASWVFLHIWISSIIHIKLFLNLCASSWRKDYYTWLTPLCQLFFVFNLYFLYILFIALILWIIYHYIYILTMRSTNFTYMLFIYFHFNSSYYFICLFSLKWFIYIIYIIHSFSLL